TMQIGRNSSDPGYIAWRDGRSMQYLNGFSISGVYRPLHIEASQDGSRTLMIVGSPNAFLFNNDTGEVLRKIGSGSTRVEGTFSPNGNYVVVYNGFGIVHLLDAEQGETIFVDEPHGYFHADTSVLNAVFSPDSTLLAVAKGNKTLLWDVATGATVQTFAHQARTLKMHFSPDGTLLAVATDAATVHLWDIKQAKEIAVLQHSDVIDWMQFHPNGAQLATLSNQQVRFWSTADGRERSVLDVPLIVPTKLGYTEDGERFFTVSQDGTLRIWD
ncbi:MAG TPA: hypothetical protein P5121_14385, partial [Caldilineaceae bacterium]|nr:hypothetical protein [Caldilineaceae bacterium]